MIKLYTVTELMSLFCSFHKPWLKLKFQPGCQKKIRLKKYTCLWILPFKIFKIK